MFTLTINTDNDAFGGDSSAKALEVARILHQVATRLTTSKEGKIQDANGNTVGRFYFTETD